MTPTPAQSLAYLEGVTMSPERAIGALESVSLGANLLELFAHYFPREFAPFRRDIVSNADDAARMFIELVGTRFFPIRDLMWEEDELLYAYAAIPIAPVNDDWWERDPHDLSVLDRAMLIGGGVLAEGAHEYTDNRAFIDYKKLARISTGPLKHLPDAVGFVFHETGNAWCDLGWEEMSFYPDEPWNKQTVNRLRVMWKSAKQVLKRARTVWEWVGEDEARAARVRDLVASCVKPPKPEPVAIRVRA